MGGPLRSCDITVVWLRDHREDKWIIVPWVYRSPSGQPFGLVLWEHVRRNPIWYLCHLKGGAAPPRLRSHLSLRRIGRSVQRRGGPRYFCKRD